jgi:glycosyltransferase involved in cell wall biosynthesis
MLAEEYAIAQKGFWEAVSLRLGLRRLAYFLRAKALCASPGVTVVSEVIFSPTWNKRFVLTVHDLKAFDDNASRGGRARRMAYSYFSGAAKRIVVVSESVRTDLIEKCGVAPHRIHVVPNGISSKSLDLALKNSANAKEYDFVYVSSFARHKRQDFLVRCAPVGSRICMIGRDLGALGDVRCAVLARGGEVHVDILETIDSDEDLFKLIGASRCGVFPSVFEGFGIPILEYAAAGLEVVAADISPFRELSGHIDRMVSPDDEQAWRAALLEVFEGSPDTSEHAICKVKSSRFTEGSIARQFQELVLSWNDENACISESLQN